MPPRILVFGTGSIGAVYAYIFSRAVTPANVFTVCRSNFDVASKNGFTINSTIFGQNLNIRPHVVRTVADAVRLSLGQPFDYVVITAKAIPTTPSLPEQIHPAVSENTTIVLIQNGIGIEALYRSSFPSNPILSCVVYLPATQTSPGTISHREVERLHIGTYPAMAPAAHKTSAGTFSNLIQQGGGTAIVHEDVQHERWKKLLVNASWNPICALSRSRDAQFLVSSPFAPDLVEKMMLEIASIAQASGYSSISPTVVTHQIGRAKARALPGIEPSMLADALAGRNMEVDAIVGNALRIAEEKGVTTLLLKAVYALINALDRSFTRDKEKNASEK
ncbi:uncharacterized protein Z518_08805 [Rhinocladiella mackenziei CBS 650.93]|uniref:2-dehydropantoate 2-reductase n=1 Tax=Rhinocladiella mackenziei CBS 650.93 TaxID=1442369 RepID=A0A0D2FLJ0_9EURO|nr:uncharacterized protein Z518_08805 [Rhinocladiella mackenziei CBS 650.93]KIX02862.1 hypothetical protein Z518_08805 [Rhinocladiella mackenziei CBS 650.93]